MSLKESMLLIFLAIILGFPLLGGCTKKEVKLAGEKVNTELGVNIARLRDDLYDVEFADSNNGWAAGYWGTIFHTKNGGKDWELQKSNINNMLIDIDFVNPDKGWIVGEYGTILHTENGGKTWQPQSGGTKRYLTALAFVDGQQGWVVGEVATILHTTDGGKNWKKQEWTRKKLKKKTPVIDMGQLLTPEQLGDIFGIKSIKEYMMSLCIIASSGRSLCIPIWLSLGER